MSTKSKRTPSDRAGITEKPLDLVDRLTQRADQTAAVIQKIRTLSLLDFRNKLMNADDVTFNTIKSFFDV